MTLHHIHIGIDVSKRYLDIFDPRTGHARIGNTPEAIAAWLDRLNTATSFAVFEATGSYDAALRTGLQAAGPRTPHPTPVSSGCASRRETGGPRP